jgi:hypothetical protein
VLVQGFLDRAQFPVADIMVEQYDDWRASREEKVDTLRKLIDQDPSTPSRPAAARGESLILADRAAAPDV